MRILFFARHYSYLRLFESGIAELARRGHQIHLSADREESMGGRGMVERLAKEDPNITLGTTPGRAAGAWTEFARRLRLGIDYLRYLDPRYADTPHLRARARDRAPRSVVAVAERLSADAREAFARLLRTLERGIPPSAHLENYIRQQTPDVVLITPLVELGSPQMDHLAAAKALGIRTALPVASWDHLSSKAVVRNHPDLLLVWNEIQKQEAIEMHGVAPERVVVTGAHCYDQWFGRAPSRSHASFCSRVGLRSDRPYVLYLCSSLFRGTASEAAFVERWVEAIRTSDDPRLKDIGILIRPHPARRDEWRDVDLSGYRNIVFWGSHPVDDEAKDDYFDSMYYSASVVGLNTSAFLEAAVVEKPVHTVLVDDISKHNQEGTIHFHYLLDVNGGLLRVARTLDEHLRLLADSLAGEGGGDVKAHRFVEGFIRPLGASVAATPLFANALERLGASPAPRPVGDGFAERALRFALYPAVGALQLLLLTQPPKACAPAISQMVLRWPATRVREAEAVRAEPAWREGADCCAARTALGAHAEAGPSARSGEEARGLEPARSRRDARIDNRARSERAAHRHRALAIGSGIRAAVLDPVPRVGEGLRQSRFSIPHSSSSFRVGALRPGIATSRLTTKTCCRSTRRKSFARATTRASSSSAAG